MSAQTMPRGGFGGVLLAMMILLAMIVLGLGSIDVGAPIIPEASAPIMRYAVPNLGEVIVPSDTHAAQKHGAEIVALIRADVIAGNGNRHDCKDGRVRIIGFIHYAGKIIWYLHVSEWSALYDAYREVTVFNTTQEYINTTLDDCGDGDHNGHTYERGSGLSLAY